ncbi:uncharacterized protein L969DRAFT_589181 [Mixia osmundae IAM 14324]|uniref:Uncharacterized protein n=1 Tax=Mixia osmundae (strain CBS 9802 / IAM 14324 / JCM 22182 / KY 12970) TaxID=764103 RepID=G7EA58_MIXOS|nr:uncharacterized protein L969DRAFT_589181 [Mixia osmundae IAM 14324]KEI37616.1 hypothetical protein L969DRAFT_589181 [Mixia osmundae IAM 14324]GAA99718.1 hypothetical protein E5Q_06421 [Mixia osmundae IAM 14324]
MLSIRTLTLLLALLLAVHACQPSSARRRTGAAEPMPGQVPQLPLGVRLQPTPVMTREESRRRARLIDQNVQPTSMPKSRTTSAQPPRPGHRPQVAEPTGATRQTQHSSLTDFHWQRILNAIALAAGFLLGVIITLC